MKTASYEHLEQWVSENIYELQLRPDKYLAITLPKGIIAEGDTWQELAENMAKLNKHSWSDEELGQPCFLVKSERGAERGQG